MYIYVHGSRRGWFTTIQRRRSSNTTLYHFRRLYSQYFNVTVTTSIRSRARDVPNRVQCIPFKSHSLRHGAEWFETLLYFKFFFFFFLVFSFSPQNVFCKTYASAITNGFMKLVDQLITINTGRPYKLI